MCSSALGMPAMKALMSMLDMLASGWEGSLIVSILRVYSHYRFGNDYSFSDNSNILECTSILYDG